jgi:DNA-binding NtrC family response regulator
MTMTQRTITALLVGKQDGCLPKLKRCLEELGMKTAYVERPNQVRNRLQKPDAPEVVFAHTEPADETWSEVVAAARQSGKQPVILASRVVDDQKYLDALEHGAFDFVVPPFRPRELRHVVDSAVAESHACSHY